MPISDYLLERSDLLLPQTTTDLIDLNKVIYEAKDDEQVLQFEVFEHYMALLIEKNGVR